MQSSLKKSLYLGLAALSFVSVAAVSTTASAKSAAKVTSDKVMTSDANTRNINLTGKNAIYSKPGTTKGAKVIATTTTAKNLKNSKTSQKNFRAYRMAKTNRGSYYYKVVSYDKQYRGWVYGGKTANAFNGGVSAYTTFKDGTLTDAQKSTTYKITNVGKTNDGTQVTYKAPAWTQYKIGRAITDSTPYKDATFSIDKTGTRTREGDTWVHIVNTNTADTKANGWILFSALSDANPVADNAVRVNLLDANGKLINTFDYKGDSSVKKGDTLGSLSQTTPTSGVYAWNLGNKADGSVGTTEAALISDIQAGLKNSGYVLTLNSDGHLNSTMTSVLAQAKYGSSVNLSLTKDNVVYTTFKPTSRDINKQSAASDTDMAVGDGVLSGKFSAGTSGDGDADAAAAATTISGIDISDALSTTAADKTALTNAVKALSSQQLSDYNDAIGQAAILTYIAPKNLATTDLFSGAKGATFTADQAVAYLNGNKELANLKSDVYPQFKSDGSITWKQVTYKVLTADAGTFGTVSKAVFGYDLNNVPTVSAPTVSGSTDNGTNPLDPDASTDTPTNTPSTNTPATK